jgi:hypothetical protein
MDPINLFSRYEGGDDPEEDQLSRAFLTQLRLSPVAHMTFLDLIRERQGERSASRISPSELLGNPIEIATQECQLRRGGGRLFSVVLTREPWRTERCVEPTAKVRRYDGVVYYGDDAVIIIENKPREDEAQLKEISGLLEHEMCPNVPTDGEFSIDPFAVNVLWSDILDRWMKLADSDMLQRSERLALRDFQELVQTMFPDLFPYSSIRSCAQAVGPLRERCGAILKLVAPDRVRREGIREYYISLGTGPVAKIYLGPDPAEDTRVLPVERIRLQMFPALMTGQAKEFYRYAGLNPDSFLALAGKGWQLAPHLVFRVRGSGPKFEAKIVGNLPRYFGFWRDNPKWIRGNMTREFAAEQWWSKLVEEGIVEEEQGKALLGSFTEREGVNACPGWKVSSHWNVERAEQRDSQRVVPGSKETAFTAEVRDKIREAFQAMGQNFDSFLRQAGGATPPKG